MYMFLFNVVCFVVIELSYEERTKSSLHCSLQSLTNRPLGGWYWLRGKKLFLVAKLNVLNLAID
jgi:hypothetical protein